MRAQPCDVHGTVDHAHHALLAIIPDGIGKIDPRPAGDAADLVTSDAKVEQARGLLEVAAVCDVDGFAHGQRVAHDVAVCVRRTEVAVDDAGKHDIAQRGAAQRTVAAGDRRGLRQHEEGLAHVRDQALLGKLGDPGQRGDALLGLPVAFLTGIDEADDNDEKQRQERNGQEQDACLPQGPGKHRSLHR